MPCGVETCPPQTPRSTEDEVRWLVAHICLGKCGVVLNVGLTPNPTTVLQAPELEPRRLWATRQIGGHSLGVAAKRTLYSTLLILPAVKVTFMSL